MNTVLSSDEIYFLPESIYLTGCVDSKMPFVIPQCDNVLETHFIWKVKISSALKSPIEILRPDTAKLCYKLEL